MSPSNRVFRFERFVLDRDRRTLERGGRDFPLRPKTYAVLSYLVEQRHRVVPRDELLAEVWRGRRIEPQGVFQSICELRAAFGRHDFIRTVRGVGYQWVAPTTECAQAHRARRGVYMGRWAHAAMGLTVGIAVAWFAMPERDFQYLEARLDLAQVRFEQGDPLQAHLLARETYEEAVAVGADHPRMASAVLLSRSPLLDHAAAEFYAGEAIHIGNRLRSPDFAAAGHERLGELLLDRGESELAAAHWSKALEKYTNVCPSGVERVRRRLAGG